MSRGLLRNALSNFMAGVIPAAVALCTVPVVISPSRSCRQRR